MINPLLLGAVYGLSEAAISAFLRSNSTARKDDKGSLLMLWILIALGVMGAIRAYLHWPAAQLHGGEALYWTGLVLFVFGLGLRWYSIVHLGRFFTVDVAVAADHSVVDTGPYRYIRHPSYSGALLAFLGWGLTLDNLASIVVMLCCSGPAFLYRIRVEEAVLQAGLGQAYTRYMGRTRRLIPLIY